MDLSWDGIGGGTIASPRPPGKWGAIQRWSTFERPPGGRSRSAPAHRAAHSADEDDERKGGKAVDIGRVAAYHRSPAGANFPRISRISLQLSQPVTQSAASSTFP